MSILSLKMRKLLLLNILLIVATSCHSEAANLSDQLHQSQSTRPNNGPRIVIYPKEPIFFIDTVNPSSRALACQTAGDQPEMFSQLRWTGPNSMNNWEELSKRHSVTEEGTNTNVWILEFKNPTNDDSGIYYCHGTYSSSDTYNASINVKVTTPIRLDNCPERQFLVEGRDRSKISCQISADEPRVTLTKDNMQPDQFNQRYKMENNDGLVISGPVNKSDAGRYLVKVRAQQTGETRQQYIDVEVHSKPEIIPLKDSELAGEFRGVEGDMALLKCNVAGTPQPLVYWLDPRRRNVTSVGGYIVNREQGTLQINKVSKVDDNGNFNCIAYNHVGEVSRFVSMTVDTLPTIINFFNKTVDEQAEVTFECRATGDPMPDFTIRRHGQNVQPYRVGDGIVKDVRTDSEGGGVTTWVHRLTIVANRTLYGLHYCNATNRAGHAEAYNLLTVNHAPDLSQTPSEQYVELGKKVALTCHIKAYPPPTVTWFSDNTQILNVQTNVKSLADGQTQIVTMMPPDNLQTFGRMTCKAENKMGRSEQNIVARYMSVPGPVIASLVEKLPTIVRVQLTVLNDGGNRVKNFKYNLVGRTLDIHNPVYKYRDDRQNDTVIDASLSTSSVYTIRNLLPYFEYKMSIQAINKVGAGDLTEFHFDTLRPTRPNPPIIIRPSVASQQNSFTSLPSEYQDGYLLKWSPPDLDNGDPVTKYIIKYYKITNDPLDMPSEIGEQRIVEQMNERPMYARLGPLEIGYKYKIQIQARNVYGDSDPVHIVIHTSHDRPPMPEFYAPSLAWFTEPSTPALIVILSLAVLSLLVMDLIFCFCFQMGIIHFIRNRCCPTKAGSVISDKGYT